MTASPTGPDIPSMPTKLKFGNMEFMAGRDDNTFLTDNNTFTSIASKDTICWSSRSMDPDAEAERGPSPARNPGPPFAVGQVILCDVPGHLSGLDPTTSVLQRGFIMEAEDPRYKIRLENGATWAQGPGTYL